MVRRWSLALGLSVLGHLLLVAVGLGIGLGRSRGLSGPIDVEVTGMRLEEVKDLPLGAPPSAAGTDGHARRRPRGPAPPPASTGTLATRAEAHPRPGAAAGDDDPDAPAPTDDLGAYGPPGSRLTVLMRLDRLRGTDYVPALEALLARLPDRRDLLDGTGLNLFESFDALLIATPHPLDPSVTFLAARHHLEDAALRAALGRGARATNRSLVWRSEGGRPVAERRSRPRAGQNPAPMPDDRLIVLAAPGLAVVTPPAYRELLLTPRRPGTPGGSIDGGGANGGGADGGGIDGGGIDGGGADVATDGGKPDASSLGWAPLLSRIDAEEGLMPPEGVVMVSMVDIFKKPAGESGVASPVIFGMPIPASAKSIVGLDDDGPFVEVEGTFADELPARRWESEWPAVQEKLRANPYLLLTGFGALVNRATLIREDRVVRFRLTVTHDEAQRLLALALHMLGGG